VNNGREGGRDAASLEEALAVLPPPQSAQQIVERLAQLDSRIVQLKGGRLQPPSSSQVNQSVEFDAPDRRELIQLATTAAQLAIRATRLRAAARKADEEFKSASLQLDARIAAAQQRGAELTDADTEDAMAAAAAADSAETAAVAAEEQAIAMDNAARAAHARHATGHGVTALVSQGRDAETRKSRYLSPVKRDVAALPSLVNEEARPKAFRARPVPRSTREPRFERLLLESELVRQQRKAEAAARLAAEEAPFRFWHRDRLTSRAGNQARSAATMKSGLAEEQLQHALLRMRDGQAKAEQLLTAATCARHSD